MEESTTVAYNVNVPFIEEERPTIPLSLSPEDRSKVSFKDDSYSMFGFGPTSLNSNFPLSMLKQESRVVSNDIIHSAPELKKKSKSFPSLTRSGDLKALLESAMAGGIPAVSEDCLSSDSHEDETINQPQNDSWAQTAQNMSDHTSCTGWGQFVDFLPLHAVGVSTQGKQVRPSRRRSRSFCTSSRYRQYSKSRAKNTKYLEQRKTRQGASSPLYNRKKCTVSTNEMAEAFRIQLTLTKK